MMWRQSCGDRCCSEVVAERDNGEEVASQIWEWEEKEVSSRVIMLM